LRVDIKNLAVGYGNGDHHLLALDRIDLSLRPGRITALIGESGSGKTTLAKALMGMLPENAHLKGEIYLDEIEINGLDETSINDLRWSKVAMVFQNGAANLNPVYRVSDQVAEPLVQRLGMARVSAGKKARMQMRKIGLTPAQADRFPHELSGGQIQRALLAMSLILDPDVLILDEPTAALDAMTKNFMSGILKNFVGRQKSILLITHDLDLARSLADDAAVLYLGRIMEYLPAEKIFEPRHPYTLALTRSFPGMGAVRDLGGIRGDALYRVVHAHSRENKNVHDHVITPESTHESGHAPQDGCLFRPRCTQTVKDCCKGNMPFIENNGRRVRCIRGGIAELLHLQSVAKAYEQVQALYPTDLTLWSGEVFCLVGETGSGKTTLAMIAAGVITSDQGRRIFDNRDMNAWIKQDYQSLASRIGVIYQNPTEAVSHRFTVFDIIAEPLRIQNKGLSKKEIHKLVQEALTDVRLSPRPEFLRRYPHELNLGAVQRLCVARALVHGPSLLIADEPTSALDPSVQAKVLKMLLNLQIEKGLTMLFVTHDIGLARKIGDRIGVMLNGRMVEIGPAAKVINRPGHPYTAMLTRSAAGRAEPATENIPLTYDGKRGCPYQDRCDRMVSECRSDSLEAVNPDSGRHLVRCRNPLRIKTKGNHSRSISNVAVS
jgi:peptide/nickel transport system ATP-binding protein